MQQIDSTKERARLAWKTRVPLSVGKRFLFKLWLVEPGLPKVSQPVPPDESRTSIYIRHV